MDAKSLDAEPHSRESERAVLAAVLVSPGELPAVSARLTAEDFFIEPHRVLFKAMIELQAASSEIGQRTLQAKLEHDRLLDDVGGTAYLGGLTIEPTDVARLRTHVELIKERAVRRRLIRTCAQIRRCG
ncbi:MAG TPA: DnaB-like helicase N-terminal domain-containing protein [Thermoanaerobaculia bacterium]